MIPPSPSNVVCCVQIRQVLRSTDHRGHSSPDFLLVSDCVFYKVNTRIRLCSAQTGQNFFFLQESIEDLVQTLFMLSSDSSQILLTYEERDSEIKLEVMKLFFEKMKTHFTWKKIPHSEHHPDFESPDIQIFKFSLLP